MGAFVDKNHALQEFLGVHYPVHLLLCPRRSGKTTLLRMFRDFFESTTSDGQTRRKNIFKNNNLAITQNASFEKEFGKHPVIYLDLSTVVGSTMANLQQEFKRHVTDLVRRLEVSGSFQKRDKLLKYDQLFLEAVLEGSLPDSQWSERGVIVLIDEYDTPTTYAVQRGYASKANDFFHNVFARLLKDNEHLGGAMLIGTLRVARPNWLTGLNNISVYKFGQTTRYAAACMFTEAETRALYDRQDKIRKLPFEFDELQNWCGGYSTRDGTKLFNSWSVSNALTKGELGSIWSESIYDTSIQDFIANLLKDDEKDSFRAQCKELLAGNGISLKLDVGIVEPLDISTSVVLWTWMYHAGYLTHKHSISQGAYSVWVRIPNSEIQSKFRLWIGDGVVQWTTATPDHGNRGTVEEDSDSDSDSS